MDNSAIPRFLDNYFKDYASDTGYNFFSYYITATGKFHITLKLEYLKNEILQKYKDSQLVKYITEVLVCLLKPNLNHYVISFHYRDYGHTTINLGEIT